MPAARDPKALLQVARLYYLENQSQQQVASQLGISRSNVSRMLTDALAQGIVEIRINDPAGRERILERQLEETFGLREARVAQRPGAFAAAGRNDQVGVLASHVLLQSLKDQMTVALSWGQALQSMVWATTTDQDHAVKLVQLVGGLSSISNEIIGSELVRELASRLGASYRYLHAPATLTTRESRDALIQEQSIAQALEAARAADIAFVGVGTPSHGSSAAVLRSLDLSKKESAEFYRQQPVGDIAARYFDKDGHALSGAVHDRVLAVTLDDLVSIPTVVGVAEGRAKVPGVLGALHGRLIDVLVCDESLARGVLARASGQATGPDTPQGDVR
jgi:DNA-binding transcriptional regulator LsrR (DeoR family)